jgi:hypothetical protein
MKRLALLLIGGYGLAFAAPPIATPDQVFAAISEYGAVAFFSSLDYQAAERLLDHIGTGDAAWVALAPELSAGADGANAEGLAIALAYALPKNATAVLKIVDPVEGDGHILAISRICGIPFIEQVPRLYKSKALRAVVAVKDPALQQVKGRCVSILKKS